MWRTVDLVSIGHDAERRGPPDALTRRTDLAFAIGVALGCAGLVGFGFTAEREAHFALNNDFSGIWAGPRAFLLGHDPYDERTWGDVAGALQPQGSSTRIYGYPAWSLLLLLPFGALPLAAASALWTYGGLLASLLAMRAFLRAMLPGDALTHGLVGAALTFSQPAIVGYLNGQWSHLLVALLAVALLALRERRATVAGLAAAALVGKPQLFLIALPSFARAAVSRGQPRAALVLAAGLALLAGLSLVAFPGWSGAYALQVVGVRVAAAAQTTTLPAALAGLFGDVGLLAGVAVIFACVVATLAFEPRSDAFLAVAIAASFLAAPYAWSYDQLVLLVPLVLAAGAVAPHRVAVARGLVVGGVAALALGGTLLHGLAAEGRGSESLNALVAATVAVLIVGALWPIRRPGGDVVAAAATAR